MTVVICGRRQFVCWLVVLMGATLLPGVGCQRSSPPPATAETNTRGWLAEVVANYRKAKSYEDAGELHMSVKSDNGEQEESTPIPFSVAFERPNKIRIHSLQASIVADGRTLRASIDPLEGQVLSTPCPEELGLENLFSDPMLSEAARGQIEAVMPQLVLLLDDDPLEDLGASGEPSVLPDVELEGELCHRVAVDNEQGTSVFWIRATDGLLRKFEFPSNAFKEKFHVAQCSIWAEFKGARANTTISADAFQFDVPQGARLVSRFLPPPPDPLSPLLGKSPEDFSFFDMQGGTVTRDSLKGKVVVLDLWATWCGWCFKGFPNLEQVYQQYKDNPRVTILAVDTDDPAVSDEKVRLSFAQAKLNLPIARDQQQLAEKIFSAPGKSLALPTMIVLGADGTIQDYHLGYDQHLAETLPRKIDQLLAGENLAQKELESHEQEQKRIRSTIG